MGKVTLWTQCLEPRPRPAPAVPAVSAKHCTRCIPTLARKSDQEILPPEAAYNDPSLDPKDFLLAVMHDPRLPMAARIDAASKVSVYIHPRLAQMTQDITAGLTIRIEGGLPALPGTNIIMPEHENTPANPKGNGHDPEP